MILCINLVNNEPCNHHQTITQIGLQHDIYGKQYYFIL